MNRVCSLIGSVALLILCAQIVVADDASAVTYAPYVTLSNTFPSTALGFYPDAAATSITPALRRQATWCPYQEIAPCQPVVSDRVCLTAATIRTAFPYRPTLVDSLFPRFDISLRLETQAEPVSMVSTEIARILLQDVLGYSVQITANSEYQTPLPRCLQNLYDFCPNIWQTDYSDSDWAHGTSPDINPQACVSAGPSGVLGRDSWFVDTYSAKKAQAAGTSPLELWVSYTRPEVVANLPRFNLTQALADPDEWFVPPQCSTPETAAKCGVAIMISQYWQPGVHMQQVVNLGLLLALYFPADTDGVYWPFIKNRLANNQHVMFFFYEPDPFTASGNVQRITLPDPTHDCYDGWQNHFDGIGPVSCDFRPETLLKMTIVNSDTDKQDAFGLFDQQHIPHEEMMAILHEMYIGTNLADATCNWLNNNTDVWSEWLKPATPRKHEITLSRSSAITIYVFLGLFSAFSLGCHIFLFVYRNHLVVKRSSYVFNQLVVMGSLIYYVALFVGIQPDTKTNCIVSQFLLSFGFICFYGALLIKQIRLYAIFNMKKLASMTITDAMLAGYLGLYAVIDTGLVIIWMGVDTPTPKLVEASSTAYAYVSQCHTNKNIFGPLLYLIRGIALLVGAFYAVRIRNLDEKYNEAKPLAVVTYNIIVVAAIVLGISIIANNDPATVFGTYMAGVSFAVCASLMMFLIPKMYEIHTGGKLDGRTGLTTIVSDLKSGDSGAGFSNLQFTKSRASVVNETRRTSAAPFPQTKLSTAVQSPSNQSMSGRANGVNDKHPTASPTLSIDVNSTNAKGEFQQLPSPSSPRSVNIVSTGSQLSPRAKSLQLHVNPSMMNELAEFIEHREAFHNYMAAQRSLQQPLSTAETASLVNSVSTEQIQVDTIVDRPTNDSERDSIQSSRQQQS